MNTRKKLAIFFFALFGICLTYVVSRSFYVNALVSQETNKLEKETFLAKYDLSLINYDDIDNELSRIEKEVLSDEIIIYVNHEEKKFKLYEIGMELDKESIKNDLFKYEKSQDYYDRYIRKSKNDHDIKVYDLKYNLNEEKLRRFLDELKVSSKVEPVKGALTMNYETRNLTYEGEIIGFELDTEESYKILVDSIQDGKYSKKVTLKGNSLYTDDVNKTVNKRISSFTSNFVTGKSRVTNLEVASSRIDGVVLYPGDVFSYYDHTGPYGGPGSSGYVYYSGVYANGVCQVASTLYNAELLAGLTTVTRYSHPDMPLYVPGGLDATVSQTTWVADFKFKNTLAYPVYISAWVAENRLTVEIWSNENALNGEELKLRSQRRGYGSYDAYREHYKDGVLVWDEFIGHSWYYTEVEELY